MQYVDCIVIGGGAAGLMCAATAAKRGKSVWILDHANKVGKKILMSGGGRCNFTNYFVEPENFLSANSHFCISALSRFTQYDFLALVEKYQLEYHEKTLGQLFCDHKAKEILHILLSECEASGVKINTHCRVDSVTKVEEGNARFHLSTSHGDLSCHSLVVATGGLSIPTMGASGFGYDLAKQFGLRVQARHASLVPFTLKDTAEQHLLSLAQSLAGVSIPVSVSCRNQSFTEALLFTHKGLSGPAILQISNYWQPNDKVEIDFLPNESLIDLLALWQQENNKSELKNLLSRYLPKRFVSAWVESNQSIALLNKKAIAQLSKADIGSIADYFHHWQCVPAGTEGYKTAEVTKGGINTDDVSSKSFEAKKTAGLFFVGEVLDVTGWLGGYNFQWAWASGYCAAQHV
ncbi:MAG: putative Rossmann fold flavoprotein [Candidatus Endobugula sp.]|jgi:predicted Rossmann fold flavoprotein